MVIGIIAGVVGYILFALGVARFASPKWHPDRGRGYDPERYSQ